MFGLVAAALAVAGARPAGDDAPVRVTVVVVAATAANTTVDPKLTDLAKEAQKRDPKLTGFRLVATEGKSIAVGASASFDLDSRKTVAVAVEKSTDADGRIGLTIKPTDTTSIKYTCACDKFFPVFTPHKTAAGETIIVAVMAKPCTQKK